MKFFDLDAYTSERAQRIDRAMRDIVDGGPTGWPEPLGIAMEHATRGGKRLRAILVLAAAEATTQEKSDPPLGAACAVELVHCYSLVHDDLPAMDNAETRRGEPTVHKAHGEAAAILTGDALLALAFDVLAQEGATRSREKAYLAATRELAHAAGPRGMVGGQTLDLGFQKATPRSFGELEFCHSGKTAALFAAAAAIGALVVNAPSETTQLIRGFGFDFGLAFQHADDLVDREHVAYAEEARRRARELAERAARTADRFGERGQPLRALAERIVRQVEKPIAQ